MSTSDKAFLKLYFEAEDASAPGSPRESVHAEPAKIAPSVEVERDMSMPLAPIVANDLAVRALPRVLNEQSLQRKFDDAAQSAPEPVGMVSDGVSAVDWRTYEIDTLSMEAGDVVEPSGHAAATVSHPIAGHSNDAVRKIPGGRVLRMPETRAGEPATMHARPVEDAQTPVEEMPASAEMEAVSTDEPGQSVSPFERAGQLFQRADENSAPAFLAEMKDDGQSDEERRLDRIMRRWSEQGADNITWSSVAPSTSTESVDASVATEADASEAMEDECADVHDECADVHETTVESEEITGEVAVEEPSEMVAEPNGEDVQCAEESSVPVESEMTEEGIADENEDGEPVAETLREAAVDEAEEPSRMVAADGEALEGEALEGEALDGEADALEADSPEVQAVEETTVHDEDESCDMVSRETVDNVAADEIVTDEIPAGEVRGEAEAFGEESAPMNESPVLVEGDAVAEVADEAIEQAAFAGREAWTSSSIEVESFAWPWPSLYLERKASGEVDALAESLLDGAERGRKVVAMTSCEPGDGCTTLLLCAAKHLAEQGRSVVMVDANLRRPGLAMALGMSVASGWEAVGGEHQSLAEIIVHSSTEHVSLLPCGGYEHPSAEMVEAWRRCLPDYLSELREHYDLVLVDLGAMAGELFESRLAPNMLHGAVDGMIIVHNVRSTSRARLAHIRQRLRSAGLPETGIAENFVA